MSPAWSRWLPCSVHLLRIVPHPYRFPRRLWGELPDPFDWDAPAWCDPGDPDEWVARATAGHAAGEEELAARHAREHYDERVRLRGDRIESFTTMCHRSGITGPATLTQLLDCLLTLELYRSEHIDGDEWLLPQMWRNPIDVLPFTLQEAAEEASSQCHERALLVGAGIRRLVLADAPPPEDAETTAVTLTLRRLGEHARVPAAQLHPAMELLNGQDMIDVDGTDLKRADLDTPVEVRLPWSQFEPFFDFEELPPPEHFH